MTFIRGFPWKGRVVVLREESDPTPYWIASIDDIVIFTGIAARGVDNVDEVTTIVRRWIDEGALPINRFDEPRGRASGANRSAADGADLL
jgi:hypothetical protein